MENESTTVPTTKVLYDLLKNPEQFFNSFSSFRFVVMFLGYYFFAVTSSIVDGISKMVSTSFNVHALTKILNFGILSSISGAFFWIPIIITIWFFTGVKFFKGDTDLKTTVLSIGYAFFWPGLFSLISLPIVILAAFFASKTIYYIGWAVYMITGIWSVVNAGIGVKTLNNFNFANTAIIVLWPIVPLIALRLYFG